MKKAFVITTVLAILVCSLTACGGGTAESSSSVAEGTTTAVTTTEEALTADTSLQEETESTADAEENPLMKYITPLVQRSDELELSALDEVTDPNMILDYFKLDKNKYPDMIVMQCPMSAAMAEIIIIKTQDKESAKSDLEIRKEKLINTDVFYPDHEDIAKNSIIGEDGDFVYFIATIDSKLVEEALKAELEK